MRNGLKLVFITLPLMLIGVGFLVFVVINKNPPERIELAERATAIRVVVAQEQTIAPQITGYGLVRPTRTYTAITQVAGTMEYVNPFLKKGDILPAGTVLIRLSPTDFNLAIALANANIRAAEARLAELSVSQDNLTAALLIENETLALKLGDLERTESLYVDGAVQQTALEGARTVWLAQRQKVLNVESSLALLPTQRAVQTEQIAVYQTNLDSANLNLVRTELTLPFAARVASVSAEVGQFVGAGMTVAQLDGVDAAEVEAQVSVTELRKLLQSTSPDAQKVTIDPTTMRQVLSGLGLLADVKLRLGDEILAWTGTVDRISDTIDQQTGTIGVIVKVDGAYSGVGPAGRPPLAKGMFVEVTLEAPHVGGIIIPRNAVRDGQVLLVGDDDRLILTPVKTMWVQEEIAVISNGLEPGARVVISSLSPAMEGMLLAVTEDTGLMAELAAVGQTK